MIYKLLKSNEDNRTSLKKKENDMIYHIINLG